MSVERKIAIWAISGATGVSSSTIAAAYLDPSLEIKLAFGPNYPRDMADFGRCVKLLEEIPEIREVAFNALSRRGGAHWEMLIEKWDSIKSGETCIREVLSDASAEHLARNVETLRTSTEVG